MSMERRTGYSERQRRQARQLIENYERRGVPAKQARALAWATIDLMAGPRVPLPRRTSSRRLEERPLRP